MNESEVFNIPAPTTELSKNIKAIDKSIVHKICSGQVVLSLAVAVKELVENSLDANANLVEVKLREHGLEYVEVSDNGSGVEEKDFEALTAKYHTSKLKEFSDLQGIETFGFRGEALSSLSALSNMVIITRHNTAENATKLELSHEGKIVKKTPHARPVGTTVILTNLFATLPVRKREFCKNIRKEFNKMCQILQAYCLAAKGVRIICTNTTSKGARTTFLSTHGSNSVLDNIQAVFGSKQVQEIIELKPPINEDENYTKELLTDAEEANYSTLNVDQDDIDKLNLRAFKLEGWISSCNHGSGRSSKDRQYFFINSRPCEPKNISKLVNEVYHRYNANHHPFVFLNIVVNRSEVDVNITPDKRRLLVNNEKILLLAIKKSLLNTFGHIPSTFKLQNTLLDSSFAFQVERNNILDVDSDGEIKLKSDPLKFSQALSQWKATGNTDGPFVAITNNKRKSLEGFTALTFKMKKIQEYLSQDTVTNEISTFTSYKSEPESDSEENKSSLTASITIMENEMLKNSKEFDELTQQRCSQNSTTSGVSSLGSEEGEKYQEYKTAEEIEALEGSESTENTVKRIDCKVKSNTKSEIFEEFEDIGNDEISLDSNIKESQNVIILDASDDEKDTFVDNCSEEILTSIEKIRKLAHIEEEYRTKGKNRAVIDRLKFKSEINPTQNKNAEEELQREITKEMFSKMDIIGQFNLGFIIVRLDQDLFIVDQHATDEKYNFENLQKTTILQYQQLTIPQSLELTAANEMILIDNIKIFEANGFKFYIDENAPVTRKVKLLAKPFSKNWEFGKDDIDELIFMLQDAPPDTMCRPSRIRAMFASRACRKSVMIGTALNKSIMKRLIAHMGEIEQPWNCPHGRPTMRHLVNLIMLKEEKEQS